MAQFNLVLVELLVVISLVALSARRLRLPYTVALVVAGLLLALLQPFDLTLTPELILGLLVPPLVFEAALHLNVSDLWRDAPIIVLLAAPGVVLTMFIVAGLVATLTPIGWAGALVFGALISATDPVAVITLFRAIGVPNRLRVLIEAESLLNDGTAVVVFGLALSAALGGHQTLAEGVANFVRVAAGGVAVGLGLGWLLAQVIARVDDALVETTITTVLAYSAYLLAERLQFSGLLAVVAAGVVSGSLGLRGMSPTTRIVLFNFWEYAAFVVNSLVFLLIGLQVNLPVLAGAWAPILWAVVAVLLARAVVVYGLSWLTHGFARPLARVRSEPIPPAWQHILVWGGQRGAISLALALSLPAALGPNRDLLRVMAFGVVLFTLLIEGTSMGLLVRRLKVAARSAPQLEYELRHGRLAALRASAARLDRLHQEGLISTHVWETLQGELQPQIAGLAQLVKEVLRAEPALEASELANTRGELLRAQRGALLQLRRDGAVSDEAFDRLIVEVDEQLTNDSARSALEPPAPA
jgi:CPA1 family monovalent cation:H+ antiporter